MSTVASGHHVSEEMAQEEGMVTKETEQRTAQIPSIAFLTGAVGSMALSAFLQAKDKKELSLFVGQWAPSFMLLGLYNKVVKVWGSD